MRRADLTPRKVRAANQVSIQFDREGGGASFEALVVQNAAEHSAERLHVVL